MSIRKFTILYVIVFFCIPVFCVAQPGGGGDPGGGAPITGIEILLGLGSLLGVKKIVKSFNQRRKN